MLLLPLLNSFMFVLTLVTASNSNLSQAVQNLEHDQHAPYALHKIVGENDPLRVPTYPELKLFKTEISNLQQNVNGLKATVSKIQKALSFANGVSVGGKMFISHGSVGNFETSNSTCFQAGGLLASPRTSAENRAIQQIVVRHNKAAFIGVTDKETEGTFTYLNGEAIESPNWSQNEPNDHGGNEDCVEIISNGRWNDNSCNENRLIICEF